MIAAVTPADYARARRVLMRADAVLAGLIKTHGECGLAAAQRTDHFSALVRAVTNQQLSTRAAATIYGRLAALIPDGPPTPQAVGGLTDEQLRQVGYSRQKISYLHDLSAHVLAGTLDLETIDALPDDEVIARLTAVKGIGRWSAEMFLMFRLHRPDVLPVGDLGIVNAIRAQYGLRKTPTPERIRRIAEPWRPYRSVACWYLWRSLENQP
jgi:DNA-3-methyladenine glycosylase II